MYQEAPLATSMERMESIDFVGAPTSADEESPWLYLLRVHVQEWKQHYKLEREAIERLEASHQRLLDQLGPLSDEAEELLLARQDQEIDEIIGLYQLRREFIRERQQRELAKL
jgi:hypothetical protein